MEAEGLNKSQEKEEVIIITDKQGNKKIIGGSIEGFTIKKPRKTVSKSCAITGLDSNWADKKTLCILLE